MNIIYNGEIYLKRGPEIIDPRNSIEYQELEDTISDIEFELSKENPDLSKAEYLEPLQAIQRYSRFQKKYHKLFRNK